MHKKTIIVEVILLALMSYSAQGMELKEPSLNHEHVVKQLSLHIFNRESDTRFEKTFLHILKSRKNPKLYPELIGMREHIVHELNHRSKGE